MIAANKFQTGFDQPKLCAMYVDKKLQGVDCVQTLSRLNRTFPGKETFVLDFFNDPKDILEAFEPYYGKAELASVSDANVVYDLQRSLNAAGIYHVEEVEGFRSEEHTSELQSRGHLVCRLLLEKKKENK